jgi:hypothetical protein
MQPWQARALEEANLFNPAFCGMLLSTAVANFAEKGTRPMPFALSFLILPIVLHERTREVLPRSTVTGLLPWIEEHRATLIDFGERARRLVPISREAVSFALAQGTLAIEPASGGLVVGERRKSPTERRTPLFTSDARDCLERASFLGRWFAAAGTTPTIFGAWGVQP